eukprot:scaffold434_cov186-Pinguiococcus_pyrenoidosus.AAC.106
MGHERSCKRRNGPSRRHACEDCALWIGKDRPRVAMMKTNSARRSQAAAAAAAAAAAIREKTEGSSKHQVYSLRRCTTGSR